MLLGLGILKGRVKDVLSHVLENLSARKRKRDLATVGRILYYVCRASGLHEEAEELLRVLEPGEVPMTDLSSLFHKLKEECRAEGRAEGREEGKQQKEVEALREQQEAILRLLDRKGISRSSYQRDVERFERVSEATDFLVDFAAAPDPSAFLKEKFGH